MTINEEKRIWNGWKTFSYKKRFSSKMRDLRPKLFSSYKKAEETARSVISGSFEELYFGTAGYELTTDNLKYVEDNLSNALSAIEYKIAIRYINKTLALGSRSDQLGWVIPERLKQLTLQKHLPNISSESFPSLNEAENLVKAFISSKSNGQKFIYEGGRILFSAVLFGGYHGTHIQFFEAIANSSTHDTNGLYLDIGLPNNALPPEFRWHADPITEALFFTFNKKHLTKLNRTNITAAWASKAFMAFSKEITPGRSITFNKLVQISQHHHAVYLPPFLSHVDGAKALAQSLPKHTWERLKNRSCDETRERIDKSDHEIVFNGPSAHSTIAYENEKKLYYAGLNLFSGKKENKLSREEIIQIIQDRISTLDVKPQKSIAMMLLAWGCELLKQRKRNGDFLSINTARQYLGSIGSKLIQTLSYRLSMPSGEDDWIDIYNEMFELIKPNGLSLASNNAISFHQFVAGRCWACPINYSAIRRYGPKGKTADANLVTYNELDDFLITLENSQCNKPSDMQKLIAALGFYTMMRVSEILSLRISDITAGPNAAIQIAKNQYQDTKSKQSQRLIPIHILLPEEILHALLNYREMRINEASKNGQAPNHYELLFCKEEKPTETLNYDYVIKPIVDRFRLITKDENIRFHHLRHSGANWLLIKLLALHYPMVIDPRIDAFNHDEFCREQINNLIHSLMNAGHHLQPILFQVANLLGHATPKTTLQSYIHLTDFMAKKILEKYIQPALNRNQLMDILGIKKSTLNNWNNELKLSKEETKRISNYLPILRERTRG